MNEKKISHVQGKGSISHNNRLFSPKNVDRSRTANNIRYISQPISEAYAELFGKAVEEYNLKQKRSDRKIKNGYYEHLFNRKPCNIVVESANGQKSFYEDVVQIGTKDDTGVNSTDADLAKLCLDEYMKGFQERNPNFHVFNAVLHMDEATPHLHIDYIPIGHYNRGVPVQNGLAQALKEMGYGGGKDAVNRWRKSERDVLKAICISHGLEIADETFGRGYSMKVEEYKEHQDRIHAYEEKEKALEKELQPLIDAKDIADSASVKGTKMLFGGNYIVSRNDFSEIERQKKALAVQQNEVRELQNHFDKERFNIQSERDKLVEEREQIQKEHKKLDERDARLHDFEQSLYRRDSQITNKENQLMERERACTELYNSQIDLNENYESVRNSYSELEKELSVANGYKKDSELLRAKVDKLETRIKSERTEYEEQLRQKEDDITAVESELTECKEELNGLKKTIDSLRNYINKLFEIGAYMARKLSMDFKDIVNRRLDGYSLKYIFGDNGRER